MIYSKFLVNAHRPAQDAADATGLPMTVFYHPDHGFDCTNTTTPILRDKKTTQHVTWLPSNFFA
jgi:hypothetical protein